MHGEVENDFDRDDDDDHPISRIVKFVVSKLSRILTVMIVEMAMRGIKSPITNVIL
jgi:hypothetical protein